MDTATEKKLRVGVRGKRYFGPRYTCRGMRAGRDFRSGCGRTFIHPGECPYCKMRLDQTIA